ncbi:glycosyltransferase family 2 protein [Paenibacillus camerounensis]|uniref:glycosyltransferase family 2 protein n=1 Tax=Paenibacillus camerounensis TaxID=1243663 RepID=UPI0005A94138|nr:glycosyltransferase family 2 protein [Paenibacillus camerounensis]
MISIIVPVYNAENYIDRCIKSIQNQTYSDFELILVDDGSNDNSFEICRKYSKTDQRIKLIRTENFGVSSARNEGLRIAKGEYVGFVDSDDWIEADMYEILIRNIIEFNADISCCNYYMNSDSSENTIENQEKYIELFNNVENCMNSFLERKIFGNSVCNKLFSTKVINHDFNESLAIGEDAIFLFESCLNSKKIISCNEAKYHYYVRIGSATKTSFSEKVFEILTFSDEIVKKVSNYCPENINKAHAYAFFSYYSVLNVIVYHKMEYKYSQQYRKVVSYLKSTTRKLISETSISKIKLLSFYLFLFNKKIYRILIINFYKNKTVDFMN